MRTHILRRSILLLVLVVVGIMTTTMARAQKIEFCSKEYSADATIALGGGTVTWNQATTTLTFKDVQAEYVEDYFIKSEGLNHLNIVLEGSNSVKCSGLFLFWNGGNVEISGKGSLMVRSSASTAILTNETKLPHTLTIKDCKFDVQTNYCSIIAFEVSGNSECLAVVVDNATFKVKGYASVSGVVKSGILGLKSLELKNCYISTPGVKLGKKNDNTSYEFIDADGETYTGEVEIVPGVDPTSVNTAKAEAPQVKRGIYTLDGVRLNDTLERLPAGIYIVDGRKVLK